MTRLSFSPGFASRSAGAGQLGFIDRYDGRTLTSAVTTLSKGASPLNCVDDFLYLPEVFTCASLSDCIAGRLLGDVLRPNWQSPQKAHLQKIGERQVTDACDHDREY